MSKGLVLTMESRANPEVTYGSPYSRQEMMFVTA